MQRNTIDIFNEWAPPAYSEDFDNTGLLVGNPNDKCNGVLISLDTTEEVLEEVAQIVADIKKSPIEMLGHVTSSYYSPNLNKSIALGVVKGGKKMLGQKLIIPMENKNINVTVADPVFLDKEGERLNAKL